MLTVIADIRAVPEHADHVRSELEKLVPPTLAEDGCVQYDLHQDDEDPAHFLFYETWETRPQWLAHMESDHLAAHRRATEGMAEVTIYEMRRVG